MKKHLLTAIQLLVTIGLLFWIFRNPEQNRKMLEALDVANEWWLLPGLLALGGGLLLQAMRWIILLDVQGIAISYWRSLRILLVGMFFNLFLLGATGGDIIKIFLIISRGYALRGRNGGGNPRWLDRVRIRRLAHGPLQSRLETPAMVARP